MKSFLSILLILSSIIFTEVVIDLCSLSDLKISLIDLSNEGKTETDIPENGEEDPEIEAFLYIFSEIASSLYNAACDNPSSMISHFKEIPNPPPQK